MAIAQTASSPGEKTVLTADRGENAAMRKRVLTPAEIEARRKNAQKSTGPRTKAGKRRVRLNALKHGVYSHAQSIWDTMVALGEDPREFQRFLRSLIAARQPADAVEMMLVEDIAMLAWKKARLDRAQAGVQARSLEAFEVARHRQARQVGLERFDGLQAEVQEKGLRRVKDSPGKFEHMLSYLEMLLERVKKNDFSNDVEPLLQGLYGQEPTLRGAGITNLFHQLAESNEATPENELLRAGLESTLREEIRDVVDEYEIFLHEHVQTSRAARHASMAPTRPQWALMIRQENALNRLIERKLKLLAQIQKERRAREAAELARRLAAQAWPQRLRQHARRHIRNYARSTKRMLIRRNKAGNLLKTKQSRRETS